MGFFLVMLLDPILNTRWRKYRNFMGSLDMSDLCV